jgi:syntaxin 16
VKLQKEGKTSVFGEEEEEEQADEYAQFESGTLLMEENKMDRKELQRRDGEIVKISQSIEELAQIFKELGALVVEQGTILDRIEYNVDLVMDKVEHGNAELRTTVKTTESQRPIKCILILVVIIFVQLLILGWKNS